MEYDVAPEDRERSINFSQQKFFNSFQQHQHNSALLGSNMKIATTSNSLTEIKAFQPIQYATNSSSRVTSSTITTTATNHSMSAATATASSTTASEQKYNSSIVMEAAATHITLIDDEEEKDPLALDSTVEQQTQQLQDHVTVKHTHSLRRHVPRIIVKPIPPEKKTTTAANIATTSAAAMPTSTITSHSSISPSSRTSSSRRIQQQQQAKAAAAAAAAAAASAASISSAGTSVSLSNATATTLSTTAITQASTMREVLASIPGFSMKPRRRSSKKISTAAQIEQTKDGKIDLETPDSILASTNLRALLNKQTFSMLPPLYQYNLIQLLPSVDREAIEMERKQTNATMMPIEAIRLGTSNLNNEFFARACLEWRERLSEGEFTPENQVKLKTEAEREKNKLDPWKLKHFEPFWGEKAANRASSSKSSISSNKSSIETCNIAITNSSSSVSGSGNGSGSTSSGGCGAGNCKSLGEQKLESKGALSGTILTTKDHTTALEPKQENKSIIECRLDQHQKTSEVCELDKPTTILHKQETYKIENSVSERGGGGQEEEEAVSTHLQQKNNDELKCDKQTEMYERIDDGDQDCYVNSEDVDKREPPSVFDLLRMQGNLYEPEAKQQKRGTKRSSDNILLPNAVSTGIESDTTTTRQQLKQDDDDISDGYVMESKQLKIDKTNPNVPKQQSKSNFVSCPTAAVVEASDVPSTTTNFQALSSSSSSSSTATTTTTTTTEQEVAEEEEEEEEEEVVEDEVSYNAMQVPIVQNATFPQEILESYAAVEQQLQLRFLQNQEQLKTAAQQAQLIAAEPVLEPTATPTKLQYFAQIQQQPTTAATTNQNIINNINSTCDSMKDAFNSVEVIAAATSNQTVELQHIAAAVVNESPSGSSEAAVDLIEQNFADAENYVLQSGDGSTDSGDTNIQSATGVGGTIPTGTKNNLNEGDFVFSSSLDHVIGSDECDNMYDNNNKAMLPKSISSATTSSSSSSSSSSTSSSPATSSAVTTSDMQEIISAANSMSNTLFQAPQQLQSHQQQQQLDDQQQQILSTSSSGSITSRHNEMFQHVQHDWNFGGIKLHQSNEKYLDVSQDQSNLSHQPHLLQQAVEIQEEEDLNDENEEDVDECIISHGISNDVAAQHIIEDEPEDDDDEMDDSDAVRDIVDELQQQHQQLLQEQNQEQLHQQYQVQDQQQQEQQQQQFPIEQLEYSNEMSESLSSDVLCEVPMSAAEMEVTSTVVTNSNSNDDSSNELNMFNSNVATISNPALNHIQHMQPQPVPTQQQQRQILVDSNGQIIRNFLMQQQQLQQQQQLLQQAQQLAAFQTNQHHQAVPQPPPQQPQQAQQQLIQHTQTQQHQLQPQKAPTLSMQVIRRQYDGTTNGQQQIFQHAVAPQQSPQPQQSIAEQANQLQQFALQQQQQQRTFLPQATNTVSPQASTSNNLMPSQQIQLQTTQHQQQQHHHLHHQQQHQQMPTFQTQAQQPKFLSKHLNIISMPRSSVNITSSSAATPSVATAFTYNPSPAISAAINATLPTAATAAAAAANNLIAVQQQHQQQASTSNTINSIKTLPSTPVGVPSTIAQQRLIMTKLPSSGKGRKATNNKLPPGAVNLERSYQICQAVIQNSPNRESLKAQLRPPSAILGQQQSSGGSSPSSTSLSNSCSSASSSPSSTAVHIKNEDVGLPSAMPPNVLGVGRPNVYKVIGPRMGFPRKKYVQRQPSPTMIRHVYAAPPGTVNMSAANSQQQLNVLQQQQQQQHHPHHHPHIQIQAPPAQHELHQNGNGQYVLVHRANVGAADNQAPRASSAPPVPQNQQFHGMNGIPITGRGRPASVDVDTSNTVHEIQQTLHGANPANIVRRNISAGNISYIDNYSAAPTTLVDGSNYIVATSAVTAAAAQSTDNSGENSPPLTDSNNCACSLNAMVICQQCGAFCHDDCISATRLCVSCVIR